MRKRYFVGPGTKRNGAIAELGVVAADEFRDGNCAPSFDVLRFFKETLKSLPESVTDVCARLDGAYYNEELIRYMRRHRIGFTVTGRLSTSIMEWIRALPEDQWKPLQVVTKDGMKDCGREWAEMPWGLNQRESGKYTQARATDSHHAEEGVSVGDIQGRA